MNIKTRILSKEEYEKVVECIEYGFELDGKKVKPNHRIAVLCVVQANTGCHDVLFNCLDTFYSSRDFIKLEINFIIHVHCFIKYVQKSTNTQIQRHPHCCLL